MRPRCVDDLRIAVPENLEKKNFFAIKKAPHEQDSRCLFPRQGGDEEAQCFSRARRGFEERVLFRFNGLDDLVHQHLLRGVRFKGKFRFEAIPNFKRRRLSFRRRCAKPTTPVGLGSDAVAEHR